MLALTRKIGKGKESSVLIEHQGEKCEIKMLEYRGGHIRLSFDAPQSMKITRKEMGGSR